MHSYEIAMARSFFATSSAPENFHHPNVDYRKNSSKCFVCLLYMDLKTCKQNSFFYYTCVLIFLSRTHTTPAGHSFHLISVVVFMFNVVLDIPFLFRSPFSTYQMYAMYEYLSYFCLINIYPYLLYFILFYYTYILTSTAPKWFIRAYTRDVRVEMQCRAVQWWCFVWTTKWTRRIAWERTNRCFSGENVQLYQIIFQPVRV